MALRYILEDGKLNVCLRNLVEWRDLHVKRRIDGDQDVQERSIVRFGVHVI